MRSVIFLFIILPPCERLFNVLQFWIFLLSRATVLSKILSEQSSSESRLDIQRAYDRIKLILSHKSDSWLEHSIIIGKSQQAREAEKKQIIDRLLKMFEKKIEMAGLVENFDRTEDEEELVDSKFKVGGLSYKQRHLWGKNTEITRPNATNVKLSSITSQAALEAQRER